MSLNDKAKLFDQMVANDMKKHSQLDPNNLYSGNPPVPVGALTPKTPSLPPIPTDVQKKLSDLVSSLKLGAPLAQIDGKLGGKTQQAINQFKQHFNIGNVSNQELFQKIKETPLAAPAQTTPANNAYPLSDLKKDVGNLGKPYVAKSSFSQKMKVLAQKYNPVQDVAGLNHSAQPQADLNEVFKPAMESFAATQSVVPSNGINVIQNLAQGIDSFILAAPDKAAAKTAVEAKINELKVLPIFAGSPSWLKALYKYSKELGGQAPASAAQQATHSSSLPAIDVKKSIQDAKVANQVAHGIADALVKPGANKKVLLWRLNKYRLNPMAKLFNQLLIETKANKNIDDQTKLLLSELNSLFMTVGQIFTDEEKEQLKSDPEVKTAMESFYTVSASLKNWRNTINKLAKKY